MRRYTRVEVLAFSLPSQTSLQENFNSKIRKFRIQEGIINYFGQMYIVAMSNMHMGHSYIFVASF